MLFSLIILAYFGRSYSLTLCEYYEKLGISKPECGALSPSVQTQMFRAPMEDDPTPAFTQFAAAIPLCRNYFHSCMASSMCESGTICSNGAGPGSCCTDPNRQRCPSTTALNINCRKARGINWCNSDTDCRGGSTMPSMCCPTGCNYNMCVHVGFERPAMSLFTRNLVFSSLGSSSSSVAELTCPDPYMLDVKCISHRPTSWCISDNECPQNSLHPRKCCTTLCGYNACVVKYNGVWQIA